MEENTLRILVGSVWIIIGAIIIYYKIKPKKMQIKKLPEIPSPNDKIIIIKNIQLSGLQTILEKFCSIYNKDKLLAVINIQNIGDGIFALTFPYDIDFDIFCYLVNFLYYPTVSKETVKSSQIHAWTKISDRRTQKAYGQNAMFFIPQEDKEYDNCYCATENGKIYKIPFSGSVMEETTLPPNYRYENCPYKYEDVTKNLGQLVF